MHFVLDVRVACEPGTRNAMIAIHREPEAWPPKHPIGGYAQYGGRARPKIVSVSVGGMNLPRYHANARPTCRKAPGHPRPTKGRVAGGGTVVRSPSECWSLADVAPPVPPRISAASRLGENGRSKTAATCRFRTWRPGSRLDAHGAWAGACLNVRQFGSFPAPVIRDEHLFANLTRAA